MTTFNEYWNGEVLACITPEQISDGTIKKGFSILRWNLAFRYYYDGMATIKAFKEASAHSEPGRVRSIKSANSVSGIRSSLVVQMKEDLEDTATEGWGAGVSDMREAFVHLASNDGRWTDTNRKYYSGELGRVTSMGNTCETAACAANFLDAYEERLIEMGKHLDDMKNKASVANRIMERVKKSNTVGTKEWNEFRSCLGEVQKVSSKVENRLWLYRLTCDPDSSGSKTLELREDALAGVGKCLSAIALVHDAVNDYNRALSAGATFGPGDSAHSNDYRHGGGWWNCGLVRRRDRHHIGWNGDPSYGLCSGPESNPGHPQAIHRHRPGAQLLGSSARRRPEPAALVHPCTSLPGLKAPTIRRLRDPDLPVEVGPRPARAGAPGGRTRLRDGVPARS